MLSPALCARVQRQLRFGMLRSGKQPVLGAVLCLLTAGISPLVLLFFTRSHKGTEAGAAGVWQLLGGRASRPTHCGGSIGTDADPCFAFSDAGRWRLTLTRRPAKAPQGHDTSRLRLDVERWTLSVGRWMCLLSPALSPQPSVVTPREQC